MKPISNVAFISMVLTMSVNLLHAQTNPPAITWQKSFGGTGADECRVVKLTQDGGYILGGFSNSGKSGNKTSPNFGNHDYWVVKIAPNGDKVWENSYGGASADVLHSLHTTTDGGYVLGGYSNSGVSGNKTSTNHGRFDYWVVKIDESGTKIWDKCFGGNSNNILHSLQKTSDGGYILGGYSNAGISGNKDSAGFGSLDFWVVKIDADGEKVWDKTFGGNSEDVLYSVLQTSDGGYLLVGSSFSGATGNKTTTICCGTDDSWVVQIDADGNKIWEASYGEGGYEAFYTVGAISDGYLLGGHSYSSSFFSKSSLNFGGNDFWFRKISGTGGTFWDQSFGGSGFDVLRSLQQTSDGGAILGGHSDSSISGNKTSGNFGVTDYWVVKVDHLGTRIWDESIGGTGIDELYSIHQTIDGGYILGGRSNSGVSGNKTTPGFGNFDYWIVKLDPAP